MKHALSGAILKNPLSVCLCVCCYFSLRATHAFYMYNTSPILEHIENMRRSKVASKPYLNRLYNKIENVSAV